VIVPFVVMELTSGSSLVNTHRPMTDSAAIHYCEGFYRDARPAYIACARMKFSKMTPPYPVSSQLKVIAQLRWRMFVNGLRSRRGKTELVSRLVVTSVFALGGAGGFLVASFFSYILVSQGKPEFLAAILWPIFLFWQLFPVMATAFTNNPDSTELLRFPLTYRSYFLVRLSFGFFDPACAIGSV
jgi:hypothetical protein